MIISDFKKVIAHHVETLWHQGAMNDASDHCAENFTYHDPTSSALTGLIDYLGYIETVRSAFPDLHLKLYDMVGEDGKVVVLWEFTGTHRAEIRGIPATGKQVKFSGMTLYTESNGKIAEAWTNWDTFGYMQQLGVLPARHQERGGWTKGAKG